MTMHWLAISLLLTFGFYISDSNAKPVNTCPPHALKDLDKMSRDEITEAFEAMQHADRIRHPDERGEAEACLDEYLKYGLDINGKTTDPLLTAQPPILRANSSRFARILLEKGADPSLTVSEESIVIKAAREYSLEEFKFWLNQAKPPIDKAGPELQKLYRAAIYSRTDDITKYLFNEGFNPIEGDALAMAGWLGKTEMVKLFLSKIEMPKHQTQLNRAFYTVATISGSRIQILKMLVAAGADVNAIDKDGHQPPLVGALIYGGTKTVVDLIKLGADVKKADQLSFATPGGRDIPGLIALAADRGNAELVKLLIEKGASIKPPKGFPTGALACALRARSESSARILLENKFPVNGYPEESEPPITHCQFDSLPILKLLVKYGVDINAHKKDGPPPLYIAAESRSPLEILKFMVQSGADVTFKTPDGYSVLSTLLTGDCDSEKIAYFLSLDKIDTSVKSKDSRSLFHLAARNTKCKKEVFELIAKAKVPIDLKTEYGKTALQIAVETNLPDTADTLIRLGADPEIKNSFGHSLAELMPANSKFENHWYQNALAKRAWTKWVADPTHLITVEEIKTALRSFAGSNKKLPPLPKYASDEIKQYYDLLTEGLTKPQTAPWEITARPLEIKEMPAEYYRKILIAGKSAESRQQHKFKPTPDQARSVLKAMVADGTAKNQDYELMTWLISASSMPLDLETLELFNFDAQTIKKDIAAMIKTKPLEYKGAPTLAAIKLGKALLAHDDSDFACGPQPKDEGMRASASNPEVADILNWLGVYGDSPMAEQGFVAKIVRMVLEKKTVCEQDRDFLLRAMRGWGHTAAPAHHETTCSILSTVKSRPMSERSLQELLLITQSIGLRSDLSEAAWLEQIKAFAETHPDATKPFGENLMQVYMGLLRYTLGNPAAIQKSESNQVKIQSSDARHGTIAKLCRIMRSDNPEIAAAGRVWIETLKADLDQPRRWPADIAFESTPTNPLTLAQEFETAKLSDDLKLIRSECAEMQKAPVKTPTSTPVVAKPKTTPTKPTIPPSDDFNPRGRARKR